MMQYVGYTASFSMRMCVNCVMVMLDTNYNALLYLDSSRLHLEAETKGLIKSGGPDVFFQGSKKKHPTPQFLNNIIFIIKNILEVMYIENKLVWSFAELEAKCLDH
jgi:hypothetical protein